LPKNGLLRVNFAVLPAFALKRDKNTLDLYISERLSGMKQDRREFLKKSLKATTIAGTAVAATSLAATSKSALEADDNGVVIGKSNKKEVLYRKTQAWEQYYKVAY